MHEKRAALLLRLATIDAEQKEQRFHEEKLRLSVLLSAQQRAQQTRDEVQKGLALALSEADTESRALALAQIGLLDSAQDRVSESITSANTRAEYAKVQMLAAYRKAQQMRTLHEEAVRSQRRIEDVQAQKANDERFLMRYSQSSVKR